MSDFEFPKINSYKVRSYINMFVFSMRLIELSKSLGSLALELPEQKCI